MEISLLPQNDQFLSEICDGHLVLDNRGQRQKIYEDNKNKNTLKKSVQCMQTTWKITRLPVYLKLLKFEEDA